MLSSWVIPLVLYTVQQVGGPCWDPDVPWSPLLVSVPTQQPPSGTIHHPLSSFLFYLYYTKKEWCINKPLDIFYVGKSELPPSLFAVPSRAQLPTIFFLLVSIKMLYFYEVWKCSMMIKNSLCLSHFVFLRYAYPFYRTLNYFLRKKWFSTEAVRI